MTSPRTALVTGASGQDGIYLSRLLHAEGLRVVGTVSPASTRARAETYVDGVTFVDLDVTDADALCRLVREVAPDEVYHLAAMSSVGRSWQEPELTWAVNAHAVTTLVGALLDLRATTGREVRLVQASSAEVGGAAAESPYAQSKAAAEATVRAAREDKGLHASVVRLFNHESPLRPTTFVTAKITRAAAEIALGRADHVTLGNLDVRRDWGFAGEYVDALRRLAGQDQPVDLEVGTGVLHSLDDLVRAAFAAAGVAGEASSYVVQDPALVRPVDAAAIVADPAPAAAVLGWRATTTFEQVVAHMVDVDLRRLRTGVEDDPAYLFAG